MPAVQNRRVHVIRDELLNTPGPPLLKGAIALWEVLHRKGEAKDSAETQRAPRSAEV